MQLLKCLVTISVVACLLPALADDQGAPRLVIDSPGQGQVLDGGAVIEFHTKNISMAAEYGDAAVAKRPAVGHLHVKVDDHAWFWIHASADQIIVAGLAAGPHQVTLQLADPNHRVLEQQVVAFSMAGAAHSH